MPAIPLLSALLPNARPTGAFATAPSQTQKLLPLHGVTILAVEDSRFACEALRLMSMRAGARLRRAETLKEAQAHLQLYRPDVVIVDLGLPDGRGEDLIQQLAKAKHRPSALLATSGDPDGRAAAIAAGADGFLEKPLESLMLICQTIQRLLPNPDSAPLLEAPLTPDPLALQDDLAHAAHRMDTDPNARGYVTAFLRGVAVHAHDDALVRAAEAAARSATNLLALRELLDRRLATSKSAFFTSS